MTPEALPHVPVDPADGVLRHLGIDGCVRLPIQIDVGRIAGELAALPGDTWNAADRDPVVQASVDSFFVIGHPRGPRPLPYEDRPPLACLPTLRRLLRETIPATPTRAIVARLCPHGLIPIHTDTPRFFRGTVRLSFQVSAERAQRLFCDDRWYAMAPGEAWALDNLRPHAIQNDGGAPRINVLADYKPSEALVRLLVEGEGGLGVRDPAAAAAITALSRERYRRMRWRAMRYEIFKRLWRRRA